MIGGIQFPLFLFVEYQWRDKNGIERPQNNFNAAAIRIGKKILQLTVTIAECFAPQTIFVK